MKPGSRSFSSQLGLPSSRRSVKQVCHSSRRTGIGSRKVDSPFPHLGKEIAPFEISWGHASSPTLYGDTLFLLCDHDNASYLLALDKRTGKEKWKNDRGEGMRSYSTPFVVRGAERDELIVNSGKRVEAFDPATGGLLWYTGESNRFPIPVPSYEDGVLYMSRGYRSGPYMAVRTGGSGDVSSSHVLWRVATGAPYVSSILYYDGLVYMANGAGIVTCVDGKTGERVWQERMDGIFSASPVAGDGKVYFLAESGEMIVLAAGRKSNVLARNSVGERSLASAAVANGQIFIRTDNHLYCVGKQSETGTGTTFRQRSLRLSQSVIPSVLLQIFPVGSSRVGKDTI